MKLRTQRRVIYAAMGLTVLSLIGGFALASIPLGQTNTAEQGTVTTTISPVTQIMWNSTEIGWSGGSFNTCASSAPCDVATLSPVTVCLGGVAGHTTCASTDWIEQVNLSTVTGSPFPGTFSFMMSVTVGGVATVGAATAYMSESSDTSIHYILLDFDIGPQTSPPPSVTAATVVINQA